MDDRRKLHRNRTYIEGQIAFNNPRRTLNCLIRNMSKDGAMIVFPDTVPLPNEFEVTFRHQGESRRANVVWIGRAQAGILLSKSTRQNLVSLEAAEQIRRLEAERDCLAGRVVQLGPSI